MKSKKLSFMRLLIMKSFLLVCFLLLAGTAQSTTFDPFITKWETDGDKKIIIPLTGSGYDFEIDWGDGSIEQKVGTLSDISHTYASANVYTVSITPSSPNGFPRIYLNGFINSHLLKDISQWGNGEWSSMNHAFSGASSLIITTTDVPILSSVTDLSYMFYNASSVNSDLNGWDVSNVTNMSYMFYNVNSFNGDLSNWNVGNVTDMSNMFYGANSFNGDLSSWDVSSVTNMNTMFNGALSFNRNLNAWNVSNVIDMSNMFFGATSFNADLSNWDVSNVTNMSNMLSNASSFNSDLGNWNVSNVTDMSNMFFGATSFNADLSNWNVSNVTNMSNMFFGATSFNADLSNWNVSKVTNMSYMFYGAHAFNGGLSGWQVSNVTDMTGMFYNANSFNSSLSGWDISNVTNAIDFLTNGKLSPSNYDALLLGWAELSASETQIPAGLDINFGGSKYSNDPTVVTARAYLTETKNWTISDGGMYIPPVISSTLLALNNSTIQVTFSERVYSNITGASDLEASDFSFAITSGRATLSSVTPLSISTTDNISFILGIGLTGKPDGAETLTLSPVTNAIYNLAGDVASTSQSNNSGPLYEAVITRNGQIGTTNSTYVDKHGKTGSSMGLNASGKSIVAP